MIPGIQQQVNNVFLESRYVLNKVWRFAIEAISKSMVSTLSKVLL
jgi:hypothetical protein